MSIINSDKAKAREKATGHSIVSPSGLARVILCPGSIAEELDAPIKPSSKAAETGTRLHDIVAGVLERSRPIPTLEFDQSIWVDDAINFFHTLKNGSPEQSEVYIEQGGDLSAFNLPMLKGTADVTIKSKDSIRIIDWKFGFKEVKATWNPQLIAYALMMLGDDVLNLPPRLPVHIHIAQPPIQNYSYWETELKTIRDYCNEVIYPAIVKADQPDAERNPGNEQCLFCGAKYNCIARAKWLREEVSKVQRAYRSKDKVTVDEWSDIYTSIVNLQKAMTELKEFLYGKLINGNSVKGYKLVQGRKTRKWKAEEDMILRFFADYEIPSDKLYESKLLSVAKAEKLMKGLKQNEDFQALVDVTFGNPQMVTEDDKRPAINPEAEIDEMFKTV